MSRTIMIMAGGTGGHIFPALAVAEYLRAQGWNAVWLGVRGGMEERLIPPRGYPMASVRFAGVRGKGILAAALLPLNLLIAFWQSARAIFRVRPDVVLGMGGYVAFPGGMMASLLARPLAVHEQNAIAGLANRVLAGVADKAMIKVRVEGDREMTMGDILVRVGISALQPLLTAVVWMLVASTALSMAERLASSWRGREEFPGRPAEEQETHRGVEQDEEVVLDKPERDHRPRLLGKEDDPEHDRH